ncbi:S4 domain-containing protein YaaA [Streptococcus caprae]|uniref:S4 domain-containing protein YaaA n=1 Tax=Streptococcus caprae TaxID=1640501 RepID=A0ABV8CVJ8_9STRE
MNYTLFTEFITLQALLKELGIIHSGGAIKQFLAEETVLFNGELETRRGKKIRIGDVVELPNQGLTITVLEPSPAERENYEVDKAEKERVAAIVKKMNKERKAASKQNKATPKTTGVYRKQIEKKDTKKPVRFPGT